MKVVVTVVGVDRVGIIARVATVLAENYVNIVSINQTILDGMLPKVQAALTAEGEALGVQIQAQHADIFLSMHRIGWVMIC